MELISYSEAKNGGLKYYYTGIPCKYGHTVKRHTISKSCVECRAQQKRKRGTTDSDRITNSKYRSKRRDIGMFTQAKSRAKLKGVPFTITYDDIVIPEFCPVFGIKLEFNKGGPKANSPSLDRIIPELGYVPGNVQVISHRANTIKNDATLEELEQIVAYIRSIISGAG